MNRRVVLLGSVAAAAAGGWRLGVSRDGANAASAATAGAAKPADGAPSLGMNLTSIDYWSPVAFIDRFKASGQWNAWGKPVSVDARGYPIGLNGQPAMFAMVPCEPGTYVFTHDGDMDVGLEGGTLVSQRRDRCVFEVKAPAAGGRAFMITALRKPATFMHFIRQKDAAAFAAGEIFAPEFLAQIEGFDTLRFMDWQRINGSPVTGETRAVESCSYADGVPLEIALMLAKKIGAHPWICLPHLATDAFVARTIETLRQATAGGPAPYLEYSNEVWNLGFPQARYAEEQAAQRWGAGTPGGTFYGFRSGQIAQLARGSGCRMVLGNQTVVPFRAPPVWDGVKRSGATDRDFAGWIIAAYVSGTLIDPSGPVLALAARNDIAGAIDNLLHSTAPGALSVATAAGFYAEHGRIAAAHGLKLLAYEGNLHLNLIPALDAQKAQARPFLEAVANSPAAATVTEANLNAFAAAGGELACLFNLSSPPSDYGYFGLANSGSWPAIRARLAHRARS